MNATLIFLYCVIFIYGIVIGSFLNVCIYRIPQKESIVVDRSHCMQCGYQLKWYDLVPIFSYLFLKGKCRKCGKRISLQYPLVEATNGIFYVLIFIVCGFGIEAFLYCFMTSALLVLSVIDFRTFEIPFGINVFIFILGVVRLVTDLENWSTYVIGFFAVSVILELIVIFSGGRAMGGGDVKLMAVAGLLLGWKLILLSFGVGCILGSIIHLARMKISGVNHQLAFGPYLAMGIFICALWGDTFIQWYLF